MSGLTGAAPSGAWLSARAAGARRFLSLPFDMNLVLPRQRAQFVIRTAVAIFLDERVDGRGDVCRLRDARGFGDDRLEHDGKAAVHEIVSQPTQHFGVEEG